MWTLSSSFFSSPFLLQRFLLLTLVISQGQPNLSGSENSPYSIPYPTYQDELWHTSSWIYDQVLRRLRQWYGVRGSYSRLLMTLARSPPETTVGGWIVDTDLESSWAPTGTNWWFSLVLMVAIEVDVFERYQFQHHGAFIFYYKVLGSHLAIMLAGSKQLLVILCNWKLFVMFPFSWNDWWIRWQHEMDILGYGPS